MYFSVLTNISAAFRNVGKSSAVKVLEDIGFFCIDNMPPQLIPNFAAMCNENTEITKVAIVTDIRGGAMFFKLSECIAKMHIAGINIKVLFLEAIRITSGFMLKLRKIKGIGQAANVKNQICLTGNAVFKAETHTAHHHSVHRLFQKKIRNLLLELPAA